MSSPTANAPVLRAAAPRAAADTAADADHDAERRQAAAVGGDELPPKRAEALRASELEAVVRDLRATARTLQRALEFRIERADGASVVRVFDRETGELLRQLPAEQVVSLAQRLAQSADAELKSRRGRGQILDERA